MEDVVRFVAPWSPWLDPQAVASKWREELVPTFRRPVFDRIWADLEQIEQYVSVTGPRRVGKSTLLRQLVCSLLDGGTDPSRILAYSFDDPSLLRRGSDGGELIEALFDHARKGEGPAYLFLDEIQTLPRWELYLKKYYDLKYPVRVVVSGSASSPIFKKSRESLLGRVKDYHVLPFSFREFLLHRFHGAHPDLVEEMDSIFEAGSNLRGMLAKSPEHAETEEVMLPYPTNALWEKAHAALKDYLVDGGFPEVWKMPTEEQKIEYLYDNQVKKVIYEDLVLAAEFRKPELLKQFYVSLLERPGQEVSLSALSREIGIGAQQVEKYLPLLEMTDLVAHAEKFRKSAHRVRQGHRKYYLGDLALRNAVLRIGRTVLDDAAMLGLYAENLVFNALRKWDGVLTIDYYREGVHEVDFVVHTGPGRYLPVEVKYRERRRRDESVKGLLHFSQKFASSTPIVVTKQQDDRGFDSSEGRIYAIPLLSFLLMFD